MNNLKLLPIIAIILACVLAPDAHATNHSPPSPVVLPMQQQDEEPDQLVEIGDKLLFQSDFGRAEEAYNAAIVADPEYAAAYAHRCYLRTFQELFSEAVADCQQAITLAPQDAEGYIYLTRAYDWSGEYEKAVEAGEQAVTLAPDSGIAHSFLGEAYVDLGDLDKGRAEHDLALQLAPDIAEVHRNLAFMYLGLGQIENLLIEIETAINLAPDFARYHNFLGSIYYNVGQYNQALDSHQQALVIESEVGDDISEAATLNNIGLVYHNQGKYNAALVQYQQALEITRKIQDLTGEGATLGNIGGVYDNQGKYDQALVQYRQALFIFGELQDRASEGTTLNNIGTVYNNQGKYEQALAYYQQALEISRQVSDRAGEGTTLHNIGAVYRMQGKYDQALALLRQALEIFREVGDRASESTTLGNIGTVYHHQGRYNQALVQYKQALEIKREVGDRAGEGATLDNIGTVYSDLGYLNKSLLKYKQALEIKRELGDRVGEGIILNNIGTVQDNQGKYDQALVQYKQALFIFGEVGDRVNKSTTLNNMGFVYNNQGKHNLALVQYQQALEIKREVGDHAGEGATTNNIGTVYLNQGKYNLALIQYKQAFDITHEVGDRAGEGATTNNIGLAYYNQGKYKQALQQYEQALKINHEVGSRAGEGNTLNNIGLAYEQQGQAEEALAHYEQAMDIFETVRATAGGDQERASFIAQHINLYNQAIKLYHQEGKDEEAFYTSERGRARSFLDSLATQDVELSDEEQQVLIDQERQAYDERFALRDQLARVRAENPLDAEWVADLEARLEEAEEAYSKALEAIDAREDELAALVPGRRRVPTLAEVQALLDEETTLLSYWVFREVGTLAFVITADELRVASLPDATPDKLRMALEHVYPFIKKDNAHPLPLRDLHSWLVAPLAEHLKTPKVGIIGHQQLHQVPFAALTDGEGYFGEQHTLFRLPSASALSHIQKNAKDLKEATRPALVFGNPTTGEEGFGELAYAGQEAASVASLLDTSVYTQTEAHEARLWSEAVGAPVVHLAAHGSYNEGNALYSAIHLAPQGEYDGRLETHEVYGLDLSSAEMVVLSACQTNVGETSAGDDIVGLTRAFFFAKTPTLVSSLWKVDDAATEALMSAFYRNWQDGMGKAQALQAAQAEVRANPKWAGPYYWAGFVVNGDPGEVSFDPSTSSGETTLRNSEPPTEGRFWMVIAGIVGLLAVVGLVISRWRKKEEPS